MNLIQTLIQILLSWFFFLSSQKSKVSICVFHGEKRKFEEKKKEKRKNLEFEKKAINVDIMELRSS